MNPIWKREFIARWRDERSYLLLLALVVLLGFSAYWSYSSALAYSTYNYNVYPYRPVVESLATRASRAGHALFETLAVGNVLMWFLLAPLLTATGVARERERGLLESLQLSRMSSLSQIVARTLSALSYLAMLQLVTMPVYFVAFSFGGIAEQEILRVWLVVAVAAFCGVGLGLAISAQSPRPSGALFAVVVLLVVWTLIAFLGGNRSVWLWYIGIGTWSAQISQFLLYSHPLTIAWTICEPNSPMIFGMLPIWAPLSVPEAIRLAFLIWAAVGVLGLLKATRDVTRVFPPSAWAQRNVLIQKWKNNREKRVEEQRARQSSKVSVEGALLADLPFDRVVRFKNPLLNREVKARFRIRRASAWVWMGRAVLSLFAVAAWMSVLFIVFFDPPSRPTAFPIVLWSVWLLGTALIATFAASSFAREREAGTWEGVQLSLFSPGEITRSKWASPLLAFAIMSSPLWLFLFVLLPIGNMNGIEFPWVALGALAVATSLCWISALGSWISLRAKSTASAICWTIGVLLALILGGWLTDNTLGIPRRIASMYYGTSSAYYGSYPYYNGSFGSNNSDYIAARRFEKMLEAWNPIVVIAALQDRGKVTSGNVYSYSYPDFYANDDHTVTNMVLFHVVVAGLGTLGLLLSVKKQLQGRLE